MGLLWFRRSRGKETKPEPEVQSDARQFQARVPLKLRGLLLLKLRPNDGLDQIRKLRRSARARTSSGSCRTVFPASRSMLRARVKSRLPIIG